MLGSLWVPRGKKTPFNNRLIRMERTSWFERLRLVGLAKAAFCFRCLRMCAITSGSTTLAITLTWPPQRSHCSISIENARLSLHPGHRPVALLRALVGLIVIGRFRLLWLLATLGGR